MRRDAEEAAEEESVPYVEDEYRNFFGIDGRLVVWIISQLHLLFAAFVLAVPLFVVIIEAIGAKSNQIKLIILHVSLQSSCQQRLLQQPRWVAFSLSRYMVCIRALCAT